MKKELTPKSLLLVAIAIIFINYSMSHYSIMDTITKALKPVVLAFVIAYLLNPIIKYLQRVSKGKIKRGLAIFLSVLIVLAFLTLFGAVMIPSIIQSAGDIVTKISVFINNPNNFNFYTDLLNSDNEVMREIVNYLNNSTQELLVKLGEYSTIAINTALNTIGSATSSIINFILVFVIAIYMLIDQKDLLHRVKRVNYALFREHVADNLVRIMKLTDETFSSFFIGKILDSIIIGILCFILMLIFKIPNAPAIGFIIGITNIIPYFGPFIGAVPAILVTIASGSFVQVIIVGVIIFALQQFDGLYLGPKIIGDKVGAGAFWIIVSVTVGGALFGVIGMLIGVPIVVLVKRLVEEFIDNKLSEKEIDLDNV